MPPLELSFGDWNTDTQTSTNIAIDGDTFELATVIPDSAIAHYDATEISGLSDGDTVSTWPEQTSNGFDLTTGTDPTYQTNVLNGNPVVRFDGTGDNMTASIGSRTQPATVLAVVSHTSTGSNGAVFDQDGSSTWQSRWDSSNSAWLAFAGSSLIGGSNDGTSHYLMTVVFDTTNSELRQDGTAVATGDAGTIDPTGLTVGARYDQSANFLDGDVAELIWCDADLRATGDLSSTEQYLADKWGITL